MANQKDVSRRIILANSLIGVGTLAVGAMGCGVAPTSERERQKTGTVASAIADVQGGWYWCRKCACLFFGQISSGTCPAGYGHDNSWSGEYSLVVGDSEAPGLLWWRWCWNCQGLAYHGPPSGLFEVGSCPGGSGHLREGSGSYTVGTSGGEGIQAGWEWCSLCSSLFYGPSANQVCPEGGNHIENPGAPDLFVTMIS